MKKQLEINNEIKAKWSAAIMMFKQLPFIYFVGFLAIMYIANAHCGERKIRKITALKKELKELRWKHISINADLMYASTETNMARRVNSLNLKVSKEKPIKIKAK